MKLVEKNAVYVQKDDLVNYCFNLSILCKITSPKLLHGSMIDVLPEEVYEKYDTEGDFIMFESAGAIAYFKNREDILDYNLLSKMNDNEIVKSYDETCDREMELLTMLNETSDRKEREELTALQKMLELKLVNLSNYRYGKKTYDKTVKKYFKEYPKRIGKTK